MSVNDTRFNLIFSIFKISKSKDLAKLLFLNMFFEFEVFAAELLEQIANRRHTIN